MLPLKIFLLVPAVFAADYRNYGNYQSSTPPHVPMDYNDRIGINPNSNLVFNFEQLRRDQPPQVEMREENMGKYMYRPSTTAEPIVPEAGFRSGPMHVNRHVDNQPDQFSQLPSVLPPVPNRYNQWNPSSMPSTTMSPPPPAPQLNALSDSFNKHAFSYLESSSSNPAQNMPASRNFYQHNHYQNDINRGSSRTSSMHSNVMPTQPTSTTAMPSRQNIERRFEEFSSRNQSPNRGQQPSANRGHYKFNWDDVTTAQSQYNPVPQQMSTVPPATVNNNRGPPPPAPTLTPWNDGFGK